METMRNNAHRVSETVRRRTLDPEKVLRLRRVLARKAIAAVPQSD